MRHLVPFRVYESQTSSGLTPEQEDFLNSHTRGTWIVNPTTGLVDIRGSFDLNHWGEKSFFGVKFGNVTGYFRCSGNKLQSLEGAPEKVDGDFCCDNSQLQSLKGAPREVGWFDCSSNQLQSLEGAPEKVRGYFRCHNNPLQSLVGAPRQVGGNFECGSSKNKFQSLVGAPEKVGGNFYCSDNELQSLEGAPKEITGEFKCDKFELPPGKWNIEGWKKILQNGSVKAKKLILTLPYFNSNLWNSKISQNPELTILELSGLWDDMPRKVRNSIRIPSDLRGDFENLLHLGRMGIF